MEALRGKSDECQQFWMDKLDAFVDRRAAEIEYLKGLRLTTPSSITAIQAACPQLYNAVGNQFTSLDTGNAQKWQSYSVETEVGEVLQRLQDFNQWDETIRDAVASLNRVQRWQHADAASWGTAFGRAATNVANDIRTNGLGGSRSNSSLGTPQRPVLMSDAFRTASPAIQASLAGIDRAYLGPQAYAAEMSRRAAEAGRLAQRRAQSAASNGGTARDSAPSGTTLSLTAHCTRGLNAQGRCMTRDEAAALEKRLQTQADNRRTAAEQDRLARAAAQATEARQRAQAQLDRQARACGYTGTADPRYRAATTICK